MKYISILALFLFPFFLAGQSIEIKEKKGEVYLMEKKKVLAGPFASAQKVYATSQYLVKTDAWGILDLSGKEVVSPRYDTIYYLTRHNYHIQQNGLHGIIDTVGATVLAPEFEDIDYYTEEGEALVKSGGRWMVYRDGLRITDEDSLVFRTPEQMPKFSDCAGDTERKQGMSCDSKEMIQFIFENIEYPREAIAQGIDGIVVVKFIVEKDGTLTDPEIVREIGGGCGEAAVRVVKKMKPWVPGKQDGELVRTGFYLPVKFQL